MHLKKILKTLTLVILTAGLLSQQVKAVSGNPANEDNLDSISSGTTTRLSVTTDGQQSVNNSYLPAISSDGRYVAFYSWAINLVSGDTNSADDVFLHNTVTGETTLVSVASDGTQGNNYSNSPSISGDGRYVAFSSGSSNLVSGDTNSADDIFLRDTQTGETSLVSRASNGTQGNDHSWDPSISSDGRYVVYRSCSTNLAGGDSDSLEDIFLFDSFTGVTELISVNSEGSKGNNFSRGPVISADGRYVAFWSASSNLVAGDTNAKYDVFLRDRQTGETTRISEGTGGIQGNGHSDYPTISSDGLYVSFDSDATNLVSGDTNAKSDIFLHNTSTGETRRLSVASNGSQGNGTSVSPAISDDGRFVGFHSIADNLVAGDTNSDYDIFLHEIETGTTTQVSVSSDGARGNISSLYASLSGNGRYIAFQSFSTNLVAGDTNNVTDIFLHDTKGIGVPGNFMGLPIQIDDPSQINTNDSTSTYTNPSLVAQGYPAGGMITAWFDHTNPNSNFNEDGNLTTYLGTYTGNSPISVHSNCVFGESCYDSHNGTDFDDSYPGEAAVAVADGDVIDVCSDYLSQSCPKGWDYGNYVLIDHQNGYATLYAHLASTSVSTGYINSGDPVGIIGNTGCGDCGTHLHFGVYYDPDYEGTGGSWPEGSEVDPFGWEGAGVDPAPNPSQNLWKFPTNEHEVINETGGTIHCPAGNCLSIIPPGVYAEPVMFDLWNSSPIAGALSLHRHAGGSIFLQILDWLFGGDSLDQSTQSEGSSTLPEPIVVEMNYDPAKIPHLDISQLAVHWWDESGGLWVPLGTVVDTETNTATAESYELGHFDLQAPLVCPADTLESNDDPLFASEITSDGTAISTLFDIEDDQDWFKFQAFEGYQYAISTQNLFGGVDTFLELYEPGGTTLLDADDNGGEGMASVLSWTAPADGVYYLRALQGEGSHFGCDAAYDLAVLEFPTANDNVGFYVPGNYRWYLKTGTADGWAGVISFGWGGVSELMPVTGDWDGDGDDTAAFYKPSQWKWYLKNDQADGWAGVTGYRWGGDAELIPIAGDWDGDGDDTMGFYKPASSEWYLKDDLTEGWTGFTKVVWGGAAGNIPIAGDWNGDGYDTIGFYVPSQNKWWLKNNLADGWTGVTGVNFGSADPMDPVAGDWDGDGVSTMGGYVPSKWSWFLKDDQVDGWSNVTRIRFGVTAGYEVLAGDWQ